MSNLIPQGKDDKQNYLYNASLMLLQSFIYCCFTVLFFATLKVTWYAPKLLRSDFNKLGITDSPAMRTGELSNVVSFFTPLGLAYPPFVWSLSGALLAGLLIFSFFPKEEGFKKLFKNFFSFILSLFGILITLFSIWGV